MSKTRLLTIVRLKNEQMSHMIDLIEMKMTEYEDDLRRKGYEPEEIETKEQADELATYSEDVGWLAQELIALRETMATFLAAQLINQVG